MLSSTARAIRCNTKMPSAAVLERHLKQGMNMNDIAAKYGSVRETVRQRLKALDLLHLVPTGKKEQQRLTREAILADRQAGLGFLSIDVKYGLTKGTAKRFAKTAGIPIEFDRFTIEPHKTIVGRVVTAGEHGGTAHLTISLPRIDMHVNALLGAPIA